MIMCYALSCSAMLSSYKVTQHIKLPRIMIEIRKLWTCEQRIREIEEGIEPEFYEVITDRKKAIQILVDLAQFITKQARRFLLFVEGV
jgi:hypothetical protein